MPRISANKAFIALNWTIRRDGEKCNNSDQKLFKNKNCGKKNEPLILDHIDNNPTNNDPDNWQALCRSCNTKKNPRGKKKHYTHGSVCVSVREGTSEQILKNCANEGRYRDWIVTVIIEEGEMLYEDAIDAGAEYAHCSQEAIKRYLKKLTSSIGLLKIEVRGDMKFVTIKQLSSKEPKKTPLKVVTVHDLANKGNQ